MKRVLLVVVLFIVTTVAAFAQKGSVSVNMGVEGALPIGYWSNNYNTGIGGSFKVIYSLNDVAQATFSTGYNKFGGDDNRAGIKYFLGIVPLLGGYRYNFSSLYVESQLGLAIQINSIDVGEGYYEQLNDLSSSSVNFSFGIGGGYIAGPIDLGLRYQNINANGASIGFIALGIAYSFSF